LRKYSIVFLQIGAAPSDPATVCGQILGLSFAWYHARHALRAAPDALPYTLSSLQIHQELVHVLILFVVLGCMTMFYTSDIIAVKHYFSPQIAGFYGAISTVANIVMFVTVPLATVMLPQIKRRQEAEKNGQALRKGFLGVALVGGGAMVCFVLFPHFVVRLLMGAKYLPYAWLLPYQAVAFYMVALANVLVLYGLALRRYRLTIMAFFAMLLLTLLMVFRHESLLQVVQNYLITGVSALCGAVIILKRDLRFHA
jgi:O-antigen/teichoic acid export membrane protein